MIVPHILFGVICGLCGVLVAVGAEGDLLHWVAFYSLAGSIGLLVSVAFGALLDRRARRNRHPDVMD